MYNCAVYMYAEASGRLTLRRLSILVLYQVPPLQYLRTRYSATRRLAAARELR